MDRRFHTNPFLYEQEDPATSPENSPGSPISGDDAKTTTTRSPKRSKRTVQKRVVSVPIGDMMDGSRSKGEGYPPSDSWAWRKYGQKPIKGSPYPRGYYRCSSSKGCPARKQVERSRLDPTMLLITYVFDHNHHHAHTTKHNHHSPAVTASPSPPPPPQDLAVIATEPDDERFPELGDDDSLLSAAAAEFGWFTDITAPTDFESPSLTTAFHVDDANVEYPMGEEDESLFADLGELPECSVVFRRSFLEETESTRRCSLASASLCGSSG